MVDPAGTWLPNTLPGIWSSTFWHLVAQLYNLALRCPTHRSGTRLPNTSTWYLIGTWVLNTCSAQPACTYHPISLDELIPAVILCDIYCLYDIVCYPVVTCYTIWTFYTPSTMLSTTFPAQAHCYCLAVSFLAHLLIRTYPCSIPRLHRLYIICQHQMLCHDITVLHATVLVSNL